MNLTRALDMVRDRVEFAVKKHSGRLVTINYVITLPDSFEGGREEFRGVTFDEVTGSVVSLPPHKFFNINQKPHTQFSAIRHLDATVYEKLDGSMIHCYRHPGTGDLTASTRMSPETPQAQAALKFLHASPDVRDLALDNIDRGFTPVFELVGPDNQIVVQYPRRRLVYLVSRNRTTGEYWLDERFPDRAIRYEIKLADVLSTLEDKREFEGFVCHLPDGLWVKAKGKWYCDRHNTVDDLMKPAYKMYEKALEDQIDDVYANVPDRYKPILENIAAEVARDYAAYHARLTTAFEEVRSFAVGEPNERKVFAWATQEMHPSLFVPIMNLYSGRDVKDYISEQLMVKYTAEKRNKLFAEDVDLGG